MVRRVHVQPSHDQPSAWPASPLLAQPMASIWPDNFQPMARQYHSQTMACPAQTMPTPAQPMQSTAQVQTSPAHFQHSPALHISIPAHTQPNPCSDKPMPTQTMPSLAYTIPAPHISSRGLPSPWPAQTMHSSWPCNGQRRQVTCAAQPMACPANPISCQDKPMESIAMDRPWKTQPKQCLAQSM
jgi:hypothetical protein